jgi:uncharacterized spore protein YtfJ
VDENQDAKGAVMNDAVNKVMDSVRQEAEARSQALGRLVAGADVARVFGQPVSSGDYTVITAAEVATGGGFGSGLGFNALGRRHRRRNGYAGGAVPGAEGAGGGVEAGEDGSPAVEGAGGGGGGGGGSTGRPVAVIVLGPDGVRVKPVLDMTKLVLTAVGAWGTVAALSIRMWRKK